MMKLLLKMCRLLGGKPSFSAKLWRDLNTPSWMWVPTELTICEANRSNLESSWWWHIVWHHSYFFCDSFSPSQCVCIAFDLCSKLERVQALPCIIDRELVWWFLYSVHVVVGWKEICDITLHVIGWEDSIFDSAKDHNCICILHQLVARLR
jgi:hypothetical protein